MIERLCFLVTYNPYNAARHFTDELAAAWRRRGTAVEIFDFSTGVLDESDVRKILAFRPTLTCSFSTINPIRDSLFFWDLLKIPHWAITLDPSIYFINLIKSPFAIVSAVDRDDCKAFEKSGFTRSFFFPHGIPATLAKSDLAEDTRPYDAVMIGSCYDYEGLRSFWQEKLSPPEQNLLETAIAYVEDPKLPKPLIEALTDAWKETKVDPKTTDFHELFYYLDRYVRGRARVELVRNLHTVPVHIFGELFREHSSSKRGWQEYLGGQPNVVFHPTLPLAEIGNVLRRSKVCLNSMPFFKNGSHERLLTALACGSIPVTSESLWVRENFSPDDLLIFGGSLPLSQVEEAIIDLLRDEGRRHSMAEEGKRAVLSAHTWDHRVITAEMLLPPLLEKIYRGEP